MSLEKLQEVEEIVVLMMDSTIESLKRDLSTIHAGRVSPSMLDNVKVDYYGTPTPLNQVSTVSVPEPRLITLQPYEKTLIPIIEKAIMDANLGYTPGNNGTAVLVPVPSLSEERRVELTKFVHKLIEEGRIAVRNVRRDALHQVNDYGKSENISEDEIKGREIELQTITDNHIKELNVQQEKKEQELMEV